MEEEIKKKRGRPFKKGNIRGKDVDSVEGKETEIEQFSLPLSEDDDSCGEIRCNHETKLLDQSLPEVENKENTLVEVDRIEFTQGKNTLTILLRRKQNRMYRVQIFLNGETEIRPVTYTGTNIAMSVWDLLKGALRK